MRINAISTIPIRQINNRRTRQEKQINNQVSFGISEHERRVRERTEELTENLGFFDKYLFGGKSKARQQAEIAIDAEDLNRDKELIRQKTINEETKKRIADQERYNEEINKINEENRIKMAALEHAQEEHIQWQKEMYA